MFCSNCGKKQQNDEARFCYNCGSQLASLQQESILTVEVEEDEEEACRQIWSNRKSDRISP